jgi:hypothetical protein
MNDHTLLNLELPGFEYDTSIPLILILEDQESNFAGRLAKDLHPALKILAYTRPYSLINRLQRALAEEEPVNSVIIYKSLTGESFLQLWAYMSEHPALREIVVYYYTGHVLYGFKGGRRMFAHPFCKINDVDLQVGIILDFIAVQHGAQALMTG